MLLIGKKNNASQTVETASTVSLGTVYRRYCHKNGCGLPAFANTDTSITINTAGVYHITAKFVVSGTVAGDVKIQMYVNDTAVNGAFATETITTADTELRTLVIDEYVLVERSRSLAPIVLSKIISFVNEGVGATITSSVVNIECVL